MIPEAPTRLRLVPISKLSAAPKWQLETMRALREPVFFWVTQGQGQINLRGCLRGFHPHNAIFIPAGTLYGFQSMTRVQGTAIFFGARHGLDLPQTPLHLRLRDAQQHAEISNLVDCVQREVDGRQPQAERAACLHLGLLAIWLDRYLHDSRNNTARTPPSMTANERLTARFATLLEREFTSTLNVSDYAAALGVTPTHLTRACRASCGRTALSLLQDRRLYDARRLLTETDMPIQDISRNLGFSTPAYFARAFAQHIGQPPSSYRKGKSAAPS